MTDQAACACLTIKYSPIDNRDGTLSDRWVCRSGCGSIFKRESQSLTVETKAEQIVRLIEKELDDRSGLSWSENCDKKTVKDLKTTLVELVSKALK